MILTTATAALRLHVSAIRVRQFIYDKRLPAKKHGRDYIIDSNDLKGVKNRKNGAPFKKIRKTQPAMKVKAYN